LHANGYSLVRHVLLEQAGWGLDRHVPELGRTLGEELLTPTRVYAADLLALIGELEVHAIAHITGGGLAGNLARVLPAGVEVAINRGSWVRPPVFDLVQRVGGVSETDLEAALNVGVGMAVVLPPGAVDDALGLLDRRGLPAWVCGAVASVGVGGDAPVRLSGRHAS
jgi:phosphoribosylformylglycinamidine cyclo-ligase